MLELERLRNEVSFLRPVKNALIPHGETGKNPFSLQRTERTAKTDALIIKAVPPQLLGFLLNSAASFNRLRSFGKESLESIPPETQTLMLAAYAVMHDLTIPFLTHIFRNRLQMENSAYPSSARRERKRQKSKELGLGIPWSWEYTLGAKDFPGHLVFLEFPYGELHRLVHPYYQ